jgi:hypothetical protein
MMSAQRGIPLLSCAKMLPEEIVAIAIATARNLNLLHMYGQKSQTLHFHRHLAVRITYRRRGVVTLWYTTARFCNSIATNLGEHCGALFCPRKATYFASDPMIQGI